MSAVALRGEGSAVELQRLQSAIARARAAGVAAEDVARAESVATEASSRAGAAAAEAAAREAAREAAATREDE